MESQNTKESMGNNNIKTSGSINQFVQQDTGISNIQKCILAISCLLILTPIVLLTVDCGSSFNDFLYPISCLFYPAIGTYYTILLYTGAYDKSKYNWIPLVIGITCVLIQGFLVFASARYINPFFPIVEDGGKPIFSNSDGYIFFIWAVLVYIISTVCLYKWETVSKIGTRWIPFTILVLASFASNILYIHITHNCSLPNTKNEREQARILELELENNRMRYENQERSRSSDVEPE